MSFDTAPEWYLEVAGQRTGPYSAEQIEGLLRDGEIRVDTRISGRGLRGPVGAGEFVEAIRLRRRGAIPPRKEQPFQPPPRPEGIEERRAENPEPAKPRAVDPAQDLFDALQHIRERQAQQHLLQQSKLLSPADDSWGQTLRSRRISPQALLIAAIIGVLGIALWGISKLGSHLGSSNSAPIAMSPPTSEPPVRAAPAVVPPPPISQPASVSPPPLTPRSRFFGSAASSHAGSSPGGTSHGGASITASPPRLRGSDSVPVDRDIQVPGDYPSQNTGTDSPAEPPASPLPSEPNPQPPGAPDPSSATVGADGSGQPVDPNIPQPID